MTQESSASEGLHPRPWPLWHLCGVAQPALSLTKQDRPDSVVPKMIQHPFITEIRKSPFLNFCHRPFIRNGRTSRVLCTLHRTKTKSDRLYVSQNIDKCKITRNRSSTSRAFLPLCSVSLGRHVRYRSSINITADTMGCFAV